MSKPPADWTPEKAKAGAAEIDRMFEESGIFDGYVEENANDSVVEMTIFPRARASAED
jgi:hypothetical protein